MSHRAFGLVLVCASLQCGDPGSRSAGFSPSSEGEVGIEDGAEEPASAALGEDPGEVGALAQALVEVLPPFGWRTMTPSTSVGFAPRSDAVVLWGRDSMLVYGGRLPDGTYSTELAGYDPTTDNWIRLPAAPLSGRSHAIAVWTGRKAYIWGGRNATYRHMSSGGVFVPYGPDNGRWYTIRSAPHILKCDPQGVWSPATQELIVFGCTGSAGTGYVAGGMAYKSGAQTWRELPAPPFSARIGARVVWAGDKMVVFGGGDPGTRAPFWDGGVYDPVSNTWATINAGVSREAAPDLGGEPRIYAAVGLTIGRYLEMAGIWGGRPADGATAFDDGSAYNPDNLSWRSIPPPGSTMPDSHRRYVSAWYGADRLFIWGGQRYLSGQPHTLLDSGASFNPLRGTWTAMEPGGPSARARASAVWTGSDAIIWGGFDQSGGTERLLADGMLYQPSPRQIRAHTVEAGYSASCAFVDDGALECWGPYTSFAVSQQVNPRRPYVMKGLGTEELHHLSLGGAHGCTIVASDGVVRCWGSNLFGALGAGPVNATVPVVVPLPRPALQVSAGGDHTCAVLDNHELWCWGYNNDGQIGNGSSGERVPPVKVSGLSGVAQVSAGGDHTCAVLTDGSARCWGRGLFGKLGDGTSQNRLTPTTVVGLGDAVQIEAGGSLTCARRADGTVSCWGSNAFGGLGQGSVNYGDNPAPLPVRELSDAVRIEVGSWYACALRASGQPVCWGDNTAGQLGDGSGVQRTLPTLVVGLSGITGISAGYSHTCARGSSGQVWCWGQNHDGQLGDGTNVVRYAPRPVLW